MCVPLVVELKNTIFSLVVTTSKIKTCQMIIMKIKNLMKYAMLVKNNKNNLNKTLK